MLCYQQNFFSPTETLNAETFSRMVISEQVTRTISAYRALLPKDDKAAARVKRTLPAICWQATFDETLSAKGNRGRWRKQAAARLNGLFIVDVDHVDRPLDEVRRWVEKMEKEKIIDFSDCAIDEERIAKLCNELDIYLIHITPSGHGLRVVAKAETAKGNLADNQQWLARNMLGTDADEACKDASRLSFCPAFEDILYINKEKLFTYDNPKYDETFGPQYRSGHSAPTRSNAGCGPHAAAHGDLPAHTVPAQGQAGSGQADGQPDGSDAADKEFKGVSYEKIITEWFRLNGGEPTVGERHVKLLKLAGDIRYVCDNNPDKIARVIALHPVGAKYALEEGDDLAHIASSAAQKQMWTAIPKRFAQVLQSAGVQLDGDGGHEESEKAPAADYEAYARRLQRLLRDSPGLREATADTPENLKMGAVLAATAMLGTYLTRCWWEHFDGRLYRLSFLTYIVGPAASGKSFITDLDRLLMEPMKSADRVGRAAEQQYKERQKSRKANEQLPEMPHPVVRYCPSTTSNAIFYRRLQDAIDNSVTDPTTGEPLHLHLITVESELATALRAQVGSWAGKNDLELKSFHNENAGVDYANADSSNGIMQVNWNQVVSGTQEAMSRKIKPQNVLDGLVTRLSLFLMPANDYKMIDRRRYQRDFDRECMLRQLGYKLEEIKGELLAPRLVECCYQYEEELTRRAALEQDRCLDYFRKRIPVLMMRHTLVRMVLRQMDSLHKGLPLEERDDDLEYARLIGDWCLEMQITMFGQMVMDALDKEAAAFSPRKMWGKSREAYNSLPDEFSEAQLREAFCLNNTKSSATRVRRLVADGFIEQLPKGTFKKIIKQV